MHCPNIFEFYERCTYVHVCVSETLFKKKKPFSVETAAAANGGVCVVAGGDGGGAAAAAADDDDDDVYFSGSQIHKREQFSQKVNKINIQYTSFCYTLYVYQCTCISMLCAVTAKSCASAKITPRFGLPGSARLRSHHQNQKVLGISSL